ncbi:hypothetical protein OFY17_13060 [Marinomonas sp. C2222]|uniref:Uncharacterized protein n=1 Tax=Marinomonas sargassi TaxID=2984494 RepID=A0ABT2YV76_9GAMM|nr:hypothetical protein [Marinomonas sargassi]MCV2403796.1 hypothetical protein [Marinomonas sargassi]
MKQLLSLTLIGVYVAAIIQFSFLVFSDVLDDGVLTYIAVGLGLLMAPTLRFYQKWKHDRSASIIVEYESGSTPFHYKLLNFPMIIVFATIGLIGFIAITNHKFASDKVNTKVFEVMGVGQKRIHYDFFEYVRISDGVSETSYILDTDTSNSYKVGDQLIVQLRSGLWGYDIVEKLVKNTNKPINRPQYAPLRRIIGKLIKDIDEY